MGLSYTSKFWHRVAPAMARHFRVIAFDHRGVGASDVPDGPYPLAVMASDAAAVLDAAGLDRAHVYGISMGGMIAQEFAINYPERVRKLVLGCTSCGGKNAIKAEQKVLKLVWERANMNAEQAFWAMAPYVYDQTTPRELIDEDFDIRVRTYPTSKGYQGQVEGIFSWESFDRLPRINAPTLVIHGENDLLVPAGNGKILADRIPNSRLVMLPETSHMFFSERAAESNSMIIEFLKE
jgi:pimeloyl-ACP methyl ester carboxylesterase